MTELATAPRYVAARPSVAARLRRALTTPEGLVWVLLVVLIGATLSMSPAYAEPEAFTRWLARMAPIALVALGQYFVLVSGEFDLSMGGVISVQVILAGTLLAEDSSRVVPVIALMLVIGALIGLVNGLVTTLLHVPGFITTLGMLLLLQGLAFYSTGGAPGSNPVDEFRVIGRGGIELPVIGYLPWALVVLVLTAAVGVVLTRRPFGRLLQLAGDNPTVAHLAGSPVWWLQTRAYVLSALAATLAGIVVVGYAEVHPSVGGGYQFTAITACVLGGVALGGGRGWLLSAMAGALVLETLLTLLNIFSVSATWRPTVQGVIILLAVALAQLRRLRRSRAP